MPTTRHFTATGFVVHDRSVLLHWHPKILAWLPPGGHIDENEDPVQAVLREIREETAIRAEVVSAAPRFELDCPPQVVPPFTIMIEDIDDPAEGLHQHIDMIYFCRVVGPTGALNTGWIWVSGDELANGVPLKRGDAPAVPPPDDVRLLALRALEVVNTG